MWNSRPRNWIILDYFGLYIKYNQRKTFTWMQTVKWDKNQQNGRHDPKILLNTTTNKYEGATNQGVGKWPTNTWDMTQNSDATNQSILIPPFEIEWPQPTNKSRFGDPKLLTARLCKSSLKALLRIPSFGFAMCPGMGGAPTGLASLTHSINFPRFDGEHDDQRIRHVILGYPTTQFSNKIISYCWLHIQFYPI